MSFKTQLDIYKALIDGKKLISEYSEGYIFFNNGFLNNDEGKLVEYAFNSPQNWSIYEEPKKKMKLFRYTIKSNTFNEIFQSQWTDREYKEMSSCVLIKTEEKELEV